ncbi:DUF4112 domain-containing protein [Roseicyclus sp. F158]|uniref:DUF4112 domain-containing protein n=1 Tax=Tropicimonas omnivorans TaxID=3075590 RepID=A0ABU3DGF7_9RHOB|nr:DUF4112 domain-containing protein [Roseicyclus sp. F158]MDT0682772.1 DUF4112 domain-containing protein [Roseicyclus sp. F158]
MSPARPADFEARLARLDRLAGMMDARYGIPFTPWRIGWDGILGLVPGIGDTLALAPAAYIALEGYRLGADRWTLARMGLNAGVDYAVGLVPFVGDFFDIAFKANKRNIALLKENLASPSRNPGAGAGVGASTNREDRPGRY